MSERRVFSLRFLIFALTPTLILLLAAETTVRLKYFLSPLGHDWTYLTTPLGRGSIVVPLAAASSVPKSGRATDDQDDQIVFRWKTPCVNGTVVSSEQHKELPRTWDEHCFRGDHVQPQRDANEFRVIFLGGSTVEDAQSDEEMMTAQFKRALPPPPPGKRLSVVNAGKANFDSRTIRGYWQSVVKDYSPNLVVYYEAWNEQQGDIKFTGMDVDQRLAAFTRHRFHQTLYYRSMLYTYLVERYGLRMVAGSRFWKVDLEQLQNFVELARAVRASGAHFVLATQVVRFPRMWKGVDTFDYHAVDALLDRLKADRGYTYNVNEISGLNQRLALFHTIDLCRQLNIPVVNILDPVEQLGDEKRTELFSDLGHLTVRGDRMVGELIAKGMTEIGEWGRW